MIERRVLIQNRLGLHARASAAFVNTASNYQSDVFVARDDMEVNAKSIMGVMLLAASQGTELCLRADGVDESEALDALESLIQARFGEES